MRAAQRRWRHCNYSHLPGIQLLLIADVASARSNLFLLRYDESRGGKTANIMGPLLPAIAGAVYSHQTMRWSRPYPVDILKAFSFSFIGF